MPLSAGDKLGYYEILAPLGKGGMGEVYRARDSKLNRDVAVKVLSPALAQDSGFMARFQREAQVLASLNHPNIAQIYGLEQNAIVMELVEGDEPRGPLGVDEALKIARQVAEALEAAHEKGIVHRDLKPGNIKVKADGTVKVLDFGLAKSADPSPTSHNAESPTLTIRATQLGVILGTAAYMAPEQAAGKPVDRRADIWSFGVVLWELLAGASGFLLFTQGAALVARPFDAGSLKFTGDPTLLAKSVGRIAAPYRGVFSASQNGVLVYMAGTISQSSDLSWFDRTGVASGHLVTTLLDGWSLSPDQRRLAAVMPSGGGQDQLALLDLPHGVPTLVSAGASDANSPVWSPDGAGLVFTDARQSRQVVTYRPVTAGGSLQAVVELGAGSYTCDWSHDGRYIAYSTLQGYGLIPVEGSAPPKAGKPSLIVHAFSNYGNAHFSPDSKWLAYDANDGSRHGVYVPNVPDGDRKWQISVGGGIDPLWRKDGKEIFYLAVDGKLMAAGVQWKGDHPEFETPKPLFDTHLSLQDFAYDVSPDGQRFLLSRPETSTSNSMLTLVTNWTAQLKK